jgi:hypothetical protein
VAVAVSIRVGELNAKLFKIPPVLAMIAHLYGLEKVARQTRTKTETAPNQHWI